MSVKAVGLILWHVALSLGAAPDADQTGDALTLKDGKVVVGEILEPSARGPYRVILRRAWYQEKFPERFAAWEKNHRFDGALARRQRRDRLKGWRSERTEDDRTTRWIDAELKRLDAPPVAPTLIVVDLPRGDVKSVKKGSKEARAALRLAWKTELRSPEGSTVADLKSALEGRGLLLDPNEALDLGDLTNLRSESDLEWLAKRAATEVLHDSGLKFIRQASLVMPEPEPGAAPSPEAMVGAIGETLKGILEDRPASDPLLPHLKRIEGSRKVGAMVTEIEVGGDGRSARGSCTLWMRTPRGWVPAIRRVQAVGPGDVGANEADQIAQDPQVASALKLVESLGLGQIDPSIKRQALATGAAAKRALAASRGAFQKELEANDLTAGRP